MKINTINIKLPKAEESIDKFFVNCRKRKKLLEDTENHHEKHLKKAKHDLTRAIAEFQDDCWDWTIVKAYYALHHAGNALLSFRKKEFSKDHSCLVIALTKYNLITEELFEQLSSLNEKFSDILSLDMAFQLRKISQYSVDEWDSIKKPDAELILNIAKKFVSYVEGKL